MGGAKKPPPPVPVFLCNVETSPKNFLTFNFNPFATKAIPSVNPKLLNLNQAHPSKNLF